VEIPLPGQGKALMNFRINPAVPASDPGGQSGEMEAKSGMGWRLFESAERRGYLLNVNCGLQGQQSYEITGCASAAENGRDWPILFHAHPGRLEKWTTTEQHIDNLRKSPARLAVAFWIHPGIRCSVRRPAASIVPSCLAGDS
jgi:hypothetical protein